MSSLFAFLGRAAVPLLYVGGVLLGVFLVGGGLFVLRDGATSVLSVLGGLTAAGLCLGLARVIELLEAAVSTSRTAR